MRGVDDAELTEPGWKPRLAARNDPVDAEPELVGLKPSWRVVAVEPRPSPAAEEEAAAGVVEVEDELSAGDTGSAAEGWLLSLCASLLPLLLLPPLLLAIAATAANVSAPVKAATVTTSRPLLSRELAMRCTPGRVALRLACAPSMPGAPDAMSTGSRRGVEVRSGQTTRKGSQRMHEAVEDSSRSNNDSKSASSSSSLSSALSLSLSPLSSWLDFLGIIALLGTEAVEGPSLDAAVFDDDEAGFVQHAAHTSALHLRHHTA